MKAPVANELSVPFLQDVLHLLVLLLLRLLHLESMETEIAPGIAGDGVLNPYEFGSTLAAAVPGSEDLHFDCDWLRDSS